MSVERVEGTPPKTDHTSAPRGYAFSAWSGLTLAPFAAFVFVGSWAIRKTFGGIPADKAIAAWIWIGACFVAGAMVSVAVNAAFSYFKKIEFPRFRTPIGAALTFAPFAFFCFLIFLLTPGSMEMVFVSLLVLFGVEL